MPRRVLITGGRGFAGRHTISHLLKTTDWDIVSIDGRKGEHVKHERLDRFTHDLRYPIPALLDVRFGEVDAVIHLAASADVHKFIENPINPVLNNFHGALNILEWARTRELSHFILCSTNEIYGPSHGGRLAQEWDPVAPPTAYSASKAAQEALAIAWWRTYGVPLVITNTMQLFGPGQPPERFIPTVVRRLMADEPIELYGQTVNGKWTSASRCWTYVTNHADALRWLLGRPPQQWDKDGWPSRWNIAGPEFSCEQIIEMVADYLDIDDPKIERVESVEARPGHELRYALDSTKIEEAGWWSPVHFGQALGSTVARLEHGA